MNELDILKEKSELIESDEYKKIRSYQIEKIIDLSTSEIDEKELKGMLKLIKNTDNWLNDYEKKLKNNK